MTAEGKEALRKSVLTRKQQVAASTSSELDTDSCEELSELYTSRVRSESDDTVQKVPWDAGGEGSRLQAVTAHVLCAVRC